MKLSLIFRAAILCSVPGRQIGVWETSRPYRERREASCWGAWMFGQGACRGWETQEEVSS